MSRIWWHLAPARLKRSLALPRSGEWGDPAQTASEWSQHWQAKANCFFLGQFQPAKICLARKRFWHPASTFEGSKLRRMIDAPRQHDKGKILCSWKNAWMMRRRTAHQMALAACSMGYSTSLRPPHRNYLRMMQKATESRCGEHQNETELIKALCVWEIWFVKPCARKLAVSGGTVTYVNTLACWPGGRRCLGAGGDSCKHCGKQSHLNCLNYISVAGFVFPRLLVCWPAINSPAVFSINAFNLNLNL